MPPKKKVCVEDSKNMVWTDDEEKLLSEALILFKSENSYEGIYQGSVKEKDELIKNDFLEAFSSENKPRFHEKLLFTREKVAAKIKQMRVSYRKPLDSGKQSGGVRVAATVFDLCNQIWSGSPATESISSGLDGAVDSADVQSHSFESSTENTTFQSQSSTPQTTRNNDRSDKSNENEDIESS